MSEVKTKKCSHCKAEIDQSAKKCMHCGTDLRSWFSRHPILTILIIIIVLPMAISAVKEQQTKVESVSPEAVAQAQADKTMLESLKITSYKIENNIIGTPELQITVKNTSKKDIDAYAIAFDLYDNFDERISEWNQHEDKPFMGLSQDLLKAGKTEDATFILSTFDKATKAKNPRVIRIHFTDGTGVK